MISKREAVNAAIRYLNESLPQPASGVRVEELFPPESETEDFRVTLSHVEEVVEPESLVERAIKSPLTAKTKVERVLKAFVVRSDGQVRRMQLYRPHQGE
ncbi:MAG: hypothetical protein H6718_01620 [Polyangiaceae bacterium]|nr:hypothetical protein [Polyangiaceae bacterium]